MLARVIQVTAPAIPHELVEEIRTSVDIVDFIGEYVVLQKRGRNYLGLCPFHSEKTPSFNVNPEKQFFYCFGCGAGGDVYNFLMKIKNLSFPEALAAMAERAGIALPAHEERDEDKARQREQQRLLEMHRLAAQFYHSLLTRHPAAQPAREYLEKRRVTSEAVQEFQLGFAPDSWDALLSTLVSRGYRPRELALAGLALPREKRDGFYDRFRNRIMFPIVDQRQRVVGFGGRVLNTGQPKYLNSPETPLFHKGRVLYGLNRAIEAMRQEGYGIIVEGYMDAIAAHQAGLRHTVASLGTAFTREQAQLLLRYTREVVIAYDADTAGQTAALRGMDILYQAGCRVRVAVLPPGLDPDDFLRREGPQAFREMAEQQALSLIAYKLERAVATRNLSTIEGKVDALNDLMPDLQRVKNAVERDEYVRLISARMNMAEGAIYAELRRQSGQLQKSGTWRDKTENYRHNKDRISLGHQPGHNGPEKQLLRYMLEEPGILPRLKQELGSEVFSDAAAREIAAALEWRMSTPGLPPLTAIMDHLSSEPARQMFAQLMVGEHPLPGGKGLEDLINKIKINRMQAQIQQKIKEMDRAEAARDLDYSRQLQEEIHALQKEISVLKATRH